MKVKCTDRHRSYIKFSNVYNVVCENTTTYEVTCDDGRSRCYPKRYFEVVNEQSLEEQLKIAEEKVAELKKLIKKRDNVEVGDKYKHNPTEDVYMVTFHYVVGGSGTYSLNKIEGSYGGLGYSWSNSSTNIQSIFGADKRAFTKL